MLAELAIAFQKSADLLAAAVSKLHVFSTVLRRALESESGTGAGLFQLQHRLAGVGESVRRPAREFEEAASAALGEVSRADVSVAALRQGLAGLQDSRFAAEATHAFTLSFGDVTVVREVEHSIGPLLEQIGDIERMSALLKRDLRPARRGFRFIQDAARLVVGWASSDTVA
jgi:hypothetical protein